MILPQLQQILYTRLLKPVLFLFDPEAVHDAFIHIGRFIGSNAATRMCTRWLYAYKDPRLEQTLHNIHFPNPVGLAAGFDKNADMIGCMPEVGFGFHEIGSITGEPCGGNRKPRLWRLPKSRGLVVYYGLKNAGCETLVQRIANVPHRIPLGINIAKTNCASTIEITDGIADYTKAFSTMSNTGDYLVINTSCPNAYGGEPFSSPEHLDLLLTQLDQIPTEKPVFLKLSADQALDHIDQIIALADKHRVHGFIASNLTKQRQLDTIHPQDREVGTGGISGKPIFDLSNKLISALYQHAGDRYTIIGTGGIFTAEDAYEKIQRGASLVQLITGMIYQGPQSIGQINHGLAKLLARDGFSHISEAIGIKCDRITKN